MKYFGIALFAFLLLSIAACKKVYDANQQYNPPLRKVRFELYTKENFSGNTRNITFSLQMHNSTDKIYDSTLSPMKVEDIPDSLHKMIFEKSVPGNDTSTLVVGFYYYLENVGYSWYLEQFPARDTFKILRYPFR
jgi:hypothetical protein